MKKSLFTFFLVVVGNYGFSQTYVNPGVDTSLTEVKTALRFYNEYVAGFKGKSIPDMAKYWPADELKQRKIPDQIAYALTEQALYAQGYQRTIIYLRPTAKYVHIKTQFSSADQKGNIMTLAITNHFVGFSDGKPFFINPTTTALANWRNKTVKNVTFYYPAYHTFNQQKADSLLKSINKLQTEWGLKPIPIRYYFANDKDEIYRLKGFDFALTMGNQLTPAGKADDTDNQVFCGGLGENYFHEVVHVYLNRLYPKSPLQEGLAVLYGGSMGRALKWHLKRVNEYLLSHPQTNLTNVDDFWYTDPFTNPGSAIQGIICEMVYKKNGIAGLKKLMQHTNYKDIFEKEFNVSHDDIDAFLKKTISEQAAN